MERRLSTLSRRPAASEAVSHKIWQAPSAAVGTPGQKADLEHLDRP